MKQITSLILAAVMLFGFAACTQPEKTDETKTLESENVTVETGKEESGKTVGQTLLDDFKKRAEKGTAQEIADGLMQNKVIQFMGGVMEIEEGLLTGFENTEIKGFEKGVTFVPMIGTIPFVGYVFELKDDTDVDAFKKTLDESANLRWNICVTADEKIVDNVGNKVFFLMCPASFEQSEEDTGDLGMTDEIGTVEDQTPALDGEAEQTPAFDGEAAN